MEAIICKAYGPPDTLVVGNAPDPAPGPGEILVRIHSAGVNFPDILSVAGTYPIPSPVPFVPGIEGAGTVAEVGDGVTRLRPGDRVCWQNNTVKGTFAQSVAVPEVSVAKVPDGIALETAACVPTVFGTARFALEHRGQLRAGETVVIHGASGGVGLAALQMAKTAGARTIATGGNAAKLARLRDHGADDTVEIGDGLRDRIFDLTAGRGADVILDPVGGAVFDASLRCLAPFGRLLVVGFTSGDFGTARSNILLIKGISVIGVNYGHYLKHDSARARASIEDVLDRMAVGEITIPVEVLDGLGSVPDALQRLSDRSVLGKIVIRI